MRVRKPSALLAALGCLLVAGLAFGAAGVTAALEEGPPKYCGLVSGPSYESGKPKSLYTVSVRKVTCSIAISWMRRLAGKPLKKDGALIVGGPAGYRCLGYLVTGLPKKAVQGWCRKGELQFYWKPPSAGTG